MPDLPLVTGTIRRGRGELPQLALVNMFSEAAITEPQRFALISFPGLEEEGTELGGGPVDALFSKGGVLSGAVLAVSDGGFYVDGTSEGTIDGPAVPSIAGNEIGAVATAGFRGVFYNGSAFSEVIFPDDANVRKVFEQAGRFIMLRDGGHSFYWTGVLADMLNGDDEIEVEGLDFASAESEPDYLVDGLPLDDGLVLGGTATIEFWTKTGDDELPYVPVTGRVFQKGVRDTGCMALFDNTFAWVSPDNLVYVAGQVPQRISDGGIEELIAASATCRTDAYFFEGHELLKISLDEVTVEFDAQTRQWHERKTGVGNFIGGPVIAGPVFGAADGKLYQHGDYADPEGYHERSFAVFYPLNGGTVPLDNVRLRTNPGQTEYLEGDESAPEVELIQSYDGGQTFDTPLFESLGEQGEYRREVEWRALGMIDAPGFFARFRVTDPCSWRVSGVSINEPHGGRSR